jgi:PIN domain nuclease of toxin-antitoxin system
LKLPLDTQILDLEPGRSKTAGNSRAKGVADPANELWLSPISTWEALVLNAKGRQRLRGNLNQWVAEATAKFREAPLTHDIVVEAQQLSLSHPDSADRFIAATAKLLHLTLVTADARLLGLGEISTLANG